MTYWCVYLILVTNVYCRLSEGTNNIAVLKNGAHIHPNLSLIHSLVQDKMIDNNITITVQDITGSDRVNLFDTICSLTSSSWAIVSIGDRSTYQRVSSTAGLLNLPHLHVPTLPDVTVTVDFEISQLPFYVDPKLLIRTAVNVISVNNPEKILFIADLLLDSPFIQLTLNEFTSAELSVKFVSLSNLPDENSITKFFTDKIKRQIFHIFLVIEKNLETIIQLASRVNILSQNYFWTIICPGYAPAEVLALIPNYSNVAIIRGNTISSSNHLFINNLDSSKYDQVTVNIINTLQLLVNAIASTISTTPSITFSECEQGIQFSAANQTRDNIIKIIDETRNRFESEATEVFAIMTTENYETGQITSNSMNRTAVFNSVNQELVILSSGSQKAMVFPNTFIGFNNKTIVVCAPAITPFINYMGPGPNYTISNIKGMLKDILIYMSEKMNFNPIIREAADGQWGGPRSGSDIFTGCVGDLQMNKAHIGGSTFTFTFERQEVIDYVFPLFEEANNVLLRLPVQTGGMWNLFRPLSIIVWIMVGVAMLLASLVGCMLARLSPLSAWNLQLPYAIRDEIKFQENLWSFIGSFMQQGQDFYPYAASSRSIMAMWWFFTLIIFSAYTADLTSFLTVTMVVKEINSLEDLVSQTKIKPYVPKGTNIDTTLEKSTNVIYQKLNAAKVYAESIDKCIENMLLPSSANLACITDYTAQLYFAKKYCQQVYVLPELFNTAPVGWIVPKDSVYFNLLKYNMQRMQEAGFIDKWFNHHWSSDAGDCFTSSADAPPVGLEGVLGAYAIIYSLYIIAVVFLFVEMFWVKGLKKTAVSFPCY